MKSFFILLCGVLLAAAAAAQRADRAGDLRQALQQARPATPPQAKQQEQQQASRHALSDQERAELRRQLAEARDAGRPTRHSER